MSDLAAPRSCARHPGRLAIALCVSCRTPLCASCATAWEGIQYCAGCLSERRATTRARRSLGSLAVVVLAGLSLGVALTWLRVALLGLLAGLG